ncbi:diadenylate cyclase CdaA [Flavobacteriales bacterium]|jgi:diadenylate cyclase|nr:diadenylate cyclase CdaA [Flavobacteriales bacterium]MDG1348703.1 diadenylate cyclase CdaA [Flavobacteriales bacterium]
MEFLNIGFIELIDIALVAVLIYQLYKLVRGTVAINIFIGLAAIYLLWKIVDAFHFQLLSEILGQFIGVGVIILVIVFQQELRKFLMFIGKGKVIKNKGLFKFNFKVEHDNHLNTHSIARACEDMAKTKTGAIMVITQIDDLAVFAETGVGMNAEISVPMIESIFYKNSPLHDGAVIIRDNKIISARCVLPVSNSDDFPGHLGMRHRAAVGITEESDAVTVIVSEETGGISYVKDGELFTKRTAEQLEQFLNRIFTKSK